MSSDATTTARQINYMVKDTPIVLPSFSYSVDYMCNCKVARILFNNGKELKDKRVVIQIPVKDSAKRRVADETNTSPSIYVYITNNNAGDGAKIFLTQYDLTVLDAIYTIQCAGYNVFTPEWVYMVMANDPSSRLTKEKARSLEESFEKLRNINIAIDCHEEFQSRRGDKWKEHEGIYESCLLPIKNVSAIHKLNGKKVGAYMLDGVSALYQYSSEIDQVVNIPVEVFRSSGNRANREEGILIRRFVVKRVAQIVNDNGLSSSRISLGWHDTKTGIGKGMLAGLGYSEANFNSWRDKKSKILKVVTGTLDVMAKNNAISGYRVYREGNSSSRAVGVSGVEIFYNESSVLRKKRRHAVSKPSTH